jgi:hypothetical protein
MGLENLFKLERIGEYVINEDPGYQLVCVT